MEGKRLALEMVLHIQDDRPGKKLKKRLIFTSKWTTAWHHGAGHAVQDTPCRTAAMKMT